MQGNNPILHCQRVLSFHIQALRTTVWVYEDIIEWKIAQSFHIQAPRTTVWVYEDNIAWNMVQKLLEFLS